MEDTEKQFLKELKVLLKKYNASIGFTCSTYSDTYGLYDDGIELCINDKQIFRNYNWELDESDIKIKGE